MTVANPNDPGELEPAGPDEVELLEVVDTGQPQDLGNGLTVDARVEIPAHRRRRDTGVPPPRRWRRPDYRQLRVCPQCHAVVPNVKEAFWHLEAVHGGESSDQADIDEWLEDLEQDHAELRAAIKGGAARWRNTGHDHGGTFTGAHLAASFIGLAIILGVVAVITVIVLLAAAHH